MLLPKISLQASKTFTLDPTASSSDESLLLYNTNRDNSTSTGLAGKCFYYWAGGASGNWTKLSTDRFAQVSNELIFVDNGGNSGYIYISMLLDHSWQVIRYKKDDANDETTASPTNNAGASRPTDLGGCQALTYN